MSDPTGGRSLRALLALLLSTLALAGCMPVTRVADEGPAVELTEVPFFPQEDYQCGPAALASVLQWSGVPATPATLAPTLMIPARQGSLQIELLAQARAQGRVPFLIPGELAALQAELAAGHPVIILQNLAFAWRPAWHYAVVVGSDPATQTLVLRSGREPRHRLGWTLFERTWARADRWGMVVLRPGELPVSVPPEAVLAAVIPFEEHQAWAVAEAVYRSAAARWPGQAVFRLGQANSLHAQARLTEAETLYRGLIVDFPDDPVIYNNLALVLADGGRWQEAEALVARALELGGPLREEFEDTQRQIRARHGR
ncbi:MAG: PA2778 family cysteine peptidase [Gammaproteobacteria bacterium]